MKVSIVTVAYNSAKTIQQTIESVLSQDYDNIEYIIVDGGSKDGTQEIIKKYGDKIKWISEPDKGIYDAMNKGLKLATGDIVGNLNADDFYPNTTVTSSVVRTFEQNDCDAVYGNKQYVDEVDTSKLLRNWVAGPYKRENFLNGWMPPHLSFYLKKEAYDKYGGYNDTFVSSGDYEMMLRMLYKHNLKPAYLDKVTVIMRDGGTSNAGISNRIRANKEDRRAWKINGLKPRWYTLYWKPLSKISQLFGN